MKFFTTLSGQRALSAACSIVLVSLMGVSTTPAQEQAEQDSPRRATSVEEVIVTAQKREESLKDVPISIGVLQGDILDADSARSVADVLNRTGGVRLVEAQPGQSAVAIRGVGPGGGAATAAYYIDELPYGLVGGFGAGNVPDAGTFDLERIEVLRGPQGTLYGANSVNGVVRIISHDADLHDYELKGRARVSSTEDGGDNYGGDLAVNVPIVDGKLAARATVSYDDLGGWIDSANVPDYNGYKVGTYRLKLNAEPTEQLRLELGAWLSRIDGNGQSNADDDRTVALDGNLQTDAIDYDLYNLTLEYDFAAFSLLSASSYIDYVGLRLNEFLLSGLQRQLIRSTTEHKIFSQEIRTQSNHDGPWQWSGGLFYRDVDQLLSQTLPNLFPFPLATENLSESWAVFGELRRKFAADRWEITVGLRYFADTVNTNALSAVITGTSGPLPRREADFDAVSPRLALTYFPSDNLTLYASLSRGFRSGQNQPAAALLSDPSLPTAIEPDSLWNYEVGGKGVLLDGRLTFDTAVYYMKWSDIQQNLLAPSGVNAFLNSKAADGLGVDAAITAQPTDRLTFGLSVGWNDLTFASEVLSRNVVLFQKGSRLNASAEWTAGASADYWFPLGGSGLKGRISVAGNYSSAVTTRFFNAAIGVGAGQSDAILNGRVAFDIEGEHWTASAYVDNVGDENGRLAAVIPGVIGALRVRPRTVGVQLSFDY